MRSEHETNMAVDKYADMVNRICMMHLKNRCDTEDVFQTVFIKYLLSSDNFESEEHEKAWFIRVTVNCCKDVLKSFFRKNTVPLDIIAEQSQEISEDNSHVLQAVMSLPKKYKDVVYLYYYEGYKATEIAHILNKNVNTVYTLLSRAKNLLKKKLGGEP